MGRIKIISSNNEGKMLMEKKVENIMPIYPDGFQKKVLFSIEPNMRSDGLYFFDYNFKMSPIIIKMILKKYSEKSKFKNVDVNFGIADVEGLLVRILDKSNNIEIKIFKSEMQFRKIGEVNNYKIALLNLAEALIVNRSNIMDDFGEVFNTIWQTEYAIIVKEIALLNLNINTRADLNSFREKDKIFREKYYEVLINCAILNDNLNSYQIIRLEEIARQFNLKSAFIIEKLEKFSSEARKSVIKDFFKNIKVTKDEKNIIAADILSLDVLRKKTNKDRDSLIKSIDSLLNIDYSNVVQIKEYLENILQKEL